MNPVEMLTKRANSLIRLDRIRLGVGGFVPLRAVGQLALAAFGFLQPHPEFINGFQML